MKAQPVHFSDSPPNREGLPQNTLPGDHVFGLTGTAYTGLKTSLPQTTEEINKTKSWFFERIKLINLLID